MTNWKEFWTGQPTVLSLDVEACVRLLTDYLRILKEKLHKCSIRSVCHAPFPCSTCRGICDDVDQVRALASALSGMRKACHAGACRMNNYYPGDTCTCGYDEWRERATRATRPEETAALTAENAQLRETLTLGLGEQESVIAGLRAENERLTGLLARSLDYADHAICKLSDGYGDPCGCGYEQFRADAAAALPLTSEDPTQPGEPHQWEKGDPDEGLL